MGRVYIRGRNMVDGGMRVRGARLGSGGSGGVVGVNVDGGGR